jgi:molybdopterin converting factor small subunit
MFRQEKIILDINHDIVSSEQTFTTGGNTILDDLLNEGKMPFLFKKVENIFLPHYNNKNLNLQEVTLKAGDNVYFIPGVSVPRYKFKDKGDEVGFKTKRSMDSANIVVIDQKLYEKHKNRRTWGNSKNSYSLEELDKILNILEINSVGTFISQEGLDMIEKNGDRILVSAAAMRLLRNCTSKTRNDIEYSELIYNYSYEECITKEDDESLFEFIQLLESIYTNNKTLVSAECIMSQITSSVKLTEKMSSRLTQMFQADHASRELAAETLTNLEINKDTMFELFLLINKNSMYIYGTKAFNQVAFKAFRNTLDTLVNSWRHGKDVLFNHVFNYSEFIDLLGTLKVLKAEHVKFFMEDIKKDMQSNLASNFLK